MEDKKLTEKESIEVITSMIERTKTRYLGSGNIMLLWGYLVTIVSLLVWIMIATTHNYAWNWLWFAIPVLGSPISCIMARKEQRVKGAVTYSDKLTSRLWIIFGMSEIILSCLCLGFYFIGDINCWGAMILFTIMIIPAAEIAQGLIIKEKCLTFGGIIGLSIGMVSVCCVMGNIPLSASWYMPLFIFAFIVMMIVPGHIINRKAKKK